MAELPYKLLVFDWDGTLMDSTAHIVLSVQKAIEELHLPPVEERVIRSFIGMSRDDALKAAMPDLGPAMQKALVKSYEEHFFTLEEMPIQPFKGAIEVLQQLHQEGYQLAVATGKSRRGLSLDLDHYNLQGLFMATRCGGEGFSKPHPQVLLEILQLAAVETHEALMIGDSEYDLIMARQSGVESLAVSYGVQSKDILLECKPLDCIDSITDLPAWLASR